MLEIIPNYHPIFVHFTIALITTSLAMLALSYLLRSKAQLQQECLIVSRWCLWLAALASILTVIAGLHAFYTVGHDAVSHKVMTIHRNWGITTFSAIWLMTAWSFLLYLKKKPVRWLFAIALTVTATLVMITGWYGAELVYHYGTGVKSLPQIEMAGHDHGASKKPLSEEQGMKESHDNHAH